MTSRTTWNEPLRIIGDHMLVERDGSLALLDSGIPGSMPCPSLVSDVLGVPVDRLIGCAELAERPLEIDWPNRRIVHGAEPRAQAVAVPLSCAPFGLYTLEMETRRGRVEAILDTGAALSYAPEDAVEGLAPTRQTTDFLPGFGRFTVDVYPLQVEVGGIVLDIECGVLPPLLQMTLALLCPSGWILGSALFRDRIVTLDLAGSVVHVLPTTDAMATDTGHDRPDEVVSAIDAPAAATGELDGVTYSVRIDAARGGDDSVRLRAAIALRGATTELERPVQLALVLDRSGSMAGPRLAAVQEAARTMAHALPAGSVLGLVTFAESATIDRPMDATGAPANLARVEDSIAQMRAGGSTALADGWCTGRDLLTGPEDGVGEARRSRMLRRVLLLSDGRANVGERSPEALARWCADAASAGITTSTIGVGAGYDEDMLRAMAVAGSGSTWYVETPAQAAEVLGEELRAMQSVSALGTTVRVTPSPRVEVTAVHGGQGTHRPPPTAAEHSVHVGELSAVAERTVVVEFLVSPDFVGQGPMRLGGVRIDAVTPDGRSPICTTLDLVWDGQVVADPMARRDWLRLQIASARLSAARAADTRHHAQGATHLWRVIALAEQQRPEIRAELAGQVEELRRLARKLERREFSPSLRKSALQRADNILTGKLGYDRTLGTR